MEKKWMYCAVYSIIQIHFVRGIWKEAPNAEDVYVSPGSNVSLICQAQKEGLVQVQWSKITNKEDMIAVYHPTYGYYCANQSANQGSCKSLVALKVMPEVSEWTLHLRNMSSSLSGKYECSITLYPVGIQKKIFNVHIQKTGKSDTWRAEDKQSNHTIEIEVNRTLEIPCFQNITSEIPSAFTFTWSVENNGIQEILIKKNSGKIRYPAINKFTSLNGRVTLSTNYNLQLSPVQVHDDGLTFSCCVRDRPRKILSFTKVKVFAKPEMPMIAEDKSMDVLGKRTFTCLLNNVFPTANLTWFINGHSPQGEKEISITNEKRKDIGGFLELKSVLTRVYDDQAVQPSNLTIWCMAVAPVPGNKVSSISSEKIMFSLGSVTPPTDLPPHITESAFGTQSSPPESTSPARYPGTPSISFADMSSSTPETTPQTSNSSVTTQGFNYSWTPSGTDASNFSWMPSETYSSPPSSAALTLHDDVLTTREFSSTTREFSEVPTIANVSTENKNYTSGNSNPKDGRPWPVSVAALLLFFIIVFGLAVRKWYQYQKEIMERPPPFKPPPPPIKYTCIQESTGSDLPCHEMETL
ncbi:PREDICTED: T-cell surface protein tactile [Condylura cristata]|uniref:T-cell surface protein tactile n=1 Tax=Condylura cristata TaxID=143302 RepID=UPI00064355BA|nr:PREDICTED: T-cell surface protein tactile [Condylura cristata]